MLATGTDAQVGQWQLACGQAGLQQARGDVVRTQVAGLNFTRQALGAWAISH
jgi:hypothetical protein